MAIGLLGKKLGMTHVYDDYGRRRTVTAIQAGPCTVLGLREQDKHGYQAVQVGFEPIKESKRNKAELGQFKQAGSGPFRYVREFRVDVKDMKVGGELTVGVFQQYELVDVTGISIGKGFQGGMKRWGWHGGNKTHGSTSHRRPGSIGSTTTPGRVWKGHHLPGHMGNAQVTVQSLRIVQLDAENNLILVEGSVPGSENQLVVISKSVKRPGVIRKPQAVQNVVDDEEVLNKNAKAAKAKKAA